MQTNIVIGREILNQGFEIKLHSLHSLCKPYIAGKENNGSDRLCVDYRELNSNLVADKYPLPLIQDQISRLRGAYYFTCLDMASGYYQIPLNADLIEYTAFVTPDG